MHGWINEWRKECMEKWFDYEWMNDWMTISLYELDTEYCQWYPAIEVQSSYPHCQPCGLHNPESQDVIYYFKIIVFHFIIENLFN